MSSPTPDNSVVLLIDWQEKLLHAMPAEAREAAERNAAIILQAANTLNIPVVVTEQYPEGLGPTAQSLRALLPESTERIAKTSFSALADPKAKAALAQTARKHVIVLGMETHICVWQTVRDLLQEDYIVSVLADSVLSRTTANREVGLQLMTKSGAELRSAETVAFEWIGDASHASFKTISRLVR